MSRAYYLSLKGKKADKSLVSQGRAFEILKKPLITEKTTVISQFSQFAFEVDPRANKDEIKQAVEKVYGVNVLAVNTSNIEGKTKRFKGILGKRSDRKKAIVTLKAGQTIDAASPAN